jgi:hypothetical protein
VSVRLALVAAIVATVVAGAAATARPSSTPCYGAAIVSARTGKVLRKLFPTETQVYDGVTDGHGGWYAAGGGLAHVRRDGSLDLAWHSTIRRALQEGTFARVADRLVVSDGRRVFAVDAASGRLLWSSAPAWARRPPAVTTVVATARRIYVGGGFTRFGNARRGGVAALDPATGRVLPWRAPPLLTEGASRIHVPGAAAKLALSASRLYVVGAFTRLGAGSRRLRRRGVAAIRTSDGAVLGFVPHAQIVQPVFVATWRRLVLLACGARVGTCYSDTGVFDGRTGRPVHRFGFSQVLGAAAVAFAGSTAYLGSGPEGGFGGRFHLIAIDLRTGAYRPWFPTITPLESTSSIAVSGDRVFVGGSYCRGA